MQIERIESPAANKSFQSGSCHQNDQCQIALVRKLCTLFWCFRVLNSKIRMPVLLHLL